MVKRGDFCPPYSLALAYAGCHAFGSIEWNHSGAVTFGSDSHRKDGNLSVWSVDCAGPLPSRRVDRKLATTLYDRVDWPWMLNGSNTFSMESLSRLRVAGADAFTIMRLAGHSSIEVP